MIFLNHSFRHFRFNLYQLHVQVGTLNTIIYDYCISSLNKIRDTKKDSTIRVTDQITVLHISI